MKETSYNKKRIHLIAMNQMFPSCFFGKHLKSTMLKSDAFTILIIK